MNSMCDICNSAATVESAGAMMVGTMILLKPVALRTLVTAHLTRFGQSLGLERSGVVKVTRKGAASLDGAFREDGVCAWDGRMASSMSDVGRGIVISDLTSC